MNKAQMGTNCKKRQSALLFYLLRLGFNPSSLFAVDKQSLATSFKTSILFAWCSFVSACMNVMQPSATSFVLDLRIKLLLLYREFQLVLQTIDS